MDLRLRVAEDGAGRAGRTEGRLADHARFALQLTLVRSVDSFVAYLAELVLVVLAHRRSESLHELLSFTSSRNARDSFHADELSKIRVPSDVGLEYATLLAYGNVGRLNHDFRAATALPLFEVSDELDRIARLSSLRNLIAHGRIFAAEDLASLVDETASVEGLRLNLKSVREDLDFLRVVVARVDDEAAARWQVERPVSSEQLFDAIGRAAGLGDDASKPYVAPMSAEHDASSSPDVAAASSPSD